MRVLILSILLLTEAFTPMVIKRERGIFVATRPKQTKLYIFKTDENLSERIKFVQQNWDNIKAAGLKQFVVDEFSDKFNSLEKAFVKEIISVEKTVEKSLLAAEKAAEVAIAEDLKKGFATKNMVDAVDAAKSLAEAASISAVADTNAVNELSYAADSVRDTIREAMQLVQQVADKAAQEAAQKSEGLKYLKGLDSNMVAKLESSVSDIKKSVKDVDNIAEAVGNVAAKDEIGLDKLELAGEELIKSAEKAGAIAEQEVGSNSLSAKVFNSLEKATSSVMDELRAAEELATTIAKVAQADADAVVAMEGKAKDIIDSVKQVELAIKDLTIDPTSLEKLRAITIDALEKIKANEAAITAIAKAVENDASTNEKAIALLQSADTGLAELVEAMKSVTDDTSTLANLKSLVKGNVNSIKALETAASENTDSAIKAAEAAASVGSGSSINVGLIESLEQFKPVENDFMGSVDLSALTSHMENIAEKVVNAISS